MMYQERFLKLNNIGNTDTVQVSVNNWKYGGDARLEICSRIGHIKKRKTIQDIPLETSGNMTEIFRMSIMEAFADIQVQRFGNPFFGGLNHDFPFFKFLFR